MTTRMLPSLFLLAVLAAGVLPAARAAQDYDGCTGFIDSLPAYIDTPGVWCLRKDLSTSMASGNAILVVTDNVAIDCNDFKVGGLAAGAASKADGIAFAGGVENATVRNCNVRGFYRGISINGGDGHLVEDNRLDNNLHIGINTTAVGAVTVRRNRVLETGGALENVDNYGIYCDAPSGGACHIDDNIVNGVSGHSGWYSSVYGIRVTRTEGGGINGNSVRNLVPSGAGKTAYGLYAGLSEAGYTSLRDNRMALGAAVAGSIAVACFGSDVTLGGNTSWGFASGVYSCIDDGGNVAH